MYCFLVVVSFNQPVVVLLCENQLGGRVRNLIHPYVFFLCFNREIKN